MKKSHVLKRLNNIIKLNAKYKKSEATPLNILDYLEETGLLGARYFVKDKHGQHHITYGWEPEDE